MAGHIHNFEAEDIEMIKRAYSRIRAIKYYFVGIFDSMNFWLRCDEHAIAVVAIMFLVMALLTARIAIFINGK